MPGSKLKLCMQQQQQQQQYLKEKSFEIVKSF
jgi:hypothetical protein